MQPSRPLVTPRPCLTASPPLPLHRSWATAGRDGQVLLWSLDGQHQLGKYAASHPIEAMAADGSDLYLGANEGRLGTVRTEDLLTR